MVGAGAAVVAVVVEGDERADDARVGDAFGHAAMIPGRPATPDGP
jgi:hypothetical protein